MVSNKSRTTGIALSFFLVAFLGAICSCTHLAFQPTRYAYSHLDSMPGPIIRDYEVSFDGAKLGYWWVSPAKEIKPRGCVIQFHGNAENRTSHAHNLRWLVEKGYYLYAWDYRGYGDSDETPSIEKTFKDSLLILDRFLEKCEAVSKNLPIFVHGQSLGGYLVVAPLYKWEKKSRVSGVILEGTFASLKAASANILNRSWITWPFQWLGYLLVSNTYASKYYLTEKQPFPHLIVHSTEDQVIKYSLGEEVYKLVAGEKIFLKATEGGHLATWFVKDGLYRNDYLSFIETASLKKR